MPEVRAMNALSSLILTGLVSLICAGCAANGARQEAAYERRIQKTAVALQAAGDADSLAAAALLVHWPKAAPAERLSLISRAVTAAPDRPDLIWLNIGACTQIESCDPMPLVTQLRRVDPGNGAAWLVSIGRATKLNDAAAVRKSLEAIAASMRFDTYWNMLIVHATNAAVRTKTIDLSTAFIATNGVSSGLTIPAYHSLVNACRAEPLQDPDLVSTCRRVAAVMRRGDTYLTELIGVAIAKQAWPEGSAQFLDATSAKSVAHYRIYAHGQIANTRLWNQQYVATRLQPMADKHTEQEVDLAEIVTAKVSPDPPAAWTDHQ